jgi:hypothetical protein
MSAATIQVWRTREKTPWHRPRLSHRGKNQRKKAFTFWVLIINFYLFHHPIFNTWSKSHKSALFQIFSQTFRLMENLNGRHLLSVGGRLTSDIFLFENVPNSSDQHTGPDSIPVPGWSIVAISSKPVNDRRVIEHHRNPFKHRTELSPD